MNRLVLLALLAMVLLIGIDRLQTYAEPFERDLMVYAVAAENLAGGQALYSEIWDHKPPAIHYTYLLFQSIFGMSPLSIWVMGFSFSVITMLGCYFAGRAIGDRKTGLLAAGLWALISGDVLLQGNQPNTEVFINAALIWAFYAQLRLCEARADRTWVLWAVLAGALFAIASLYKQVAAATAVVIMGFWLIQQRGRFQFTAVLLAASVAAIAWFTVLSLFYLNGQLQDALDAAWRYNTSYSGSLTQNFISSFSPGQHELGAIYHWLPILAIAVAGSVYHSIWRHQHRVQLLLAYLLGAYVAVILPGRFFGHYYQLLLPPMVIAAAYTVQQLWQTRQRWGLAIILLAVFVLSLARLHQKTMDINTITILKYGDFQGLSFIESKNLGLWLKNNLDRETPIYHWGSEPGIYFWSGRASPVRFSYAHPLYSKLGNERNYTGELIAALEAQPPELVIANVAHLHNNAHPMAMWVQQNYQVIESPVPLQTFLLMQRNNPKND